MKKILLLSFTLFNIAANAEGFKTFKIANPNHKRVGIPATKSNKKNAKILSVAITALHGYVPGTTMNLHFSYLNLSTSDGEYCDSLAISMPIGFTINSTSATPHFPSSDSTAGGVGGPFFAMLNGISGQTISWGRNKNDSLGAIAASSPVYFSLNVTISPSISGTQTGLFHASGDGFSKTPTDANGTITIPVAPANDAKIEAISFITPQCGLTANESVSILVRNAGTTAITNLPVSFKVNGGTAINGTITKTLAAFDTAIYTMNGFNLSAPGAYTILASTNLAGDANHANDTMSTYTGNTIYELSTNGLSYTNGFESPADSAKVAQMIEEDTNNDGISWAILGTPHQGKNSAGLNAGAAYDDWLFTGCLNLSAGLNYTLGFYLKSSGLTSPTLISTSIGTSAASTAMTTSLTVGSNPTDTLYHLVSKTFTVPTSGIYYIGFHGVATNASQSAVKIDDINISTPGALGIENVQAISLHIFPNPSTGIIYLNTPADNYSVELFNIVGNKLISINKVAAGQSSLDLSSLQNGLYILKATNGANTMTEKISINK